MGLRWDDEIWKIAQWIYMINWQLKWMIIITKLLRKMIIDRWVKLIGKGVHLKLCVIFCSNDGYKIGYSCDNYPQPLTNLPFNPINRSREESREMVDLPNDLAKPFEIGQALYKTGGCSVDYPIIITLCVPNRDELPGIYIYPVPH